MDTLETIAISQAEVMDRLVKMNHSLIQELAQYRRMDAEEKELNWILDRINKGGDTWCHGNSL